jgi:type III secretory pathway component EscT
LFFGHHCPLEYQQCLDFYEQSFSRILMTRYCMAGYCFLFFFNGPLPFVLALLVQKYEICKSKTLHFHDHSVGCRFRIYQNPE